MAAYVIVDIEVLDHERYAKYREMTTPTIEQYGGKYLVRGGVCSTVEGDWEPNRIVVVEFDSRDQAELWLSSPEYAPAKELRHETARSQMILVDGV